MAQTYFAKINKAAGAECRNRRKVRLMINILAVAGGLFEMGEFKVRSWENGADGSGLFSYSPDYSGFFGLFLMFMLAFFGAFAVYGVFSDLTNKQTADVQLSLPMSAKDRYLSKLLAVARLQLLPFAVETAAMLVTAAFKGAPILGETLIYVLQVHGVILAEALFVDAICIFCMCCCGAKAEGVYTSLITGGCVTMTPYMVINYIMETFSGVSYSRDDVGKFCAGFGGMVATCFPETDLFSTAESFGVMFINIVLSCLLVFASFYIYRKRDGRQVGKPMVYDLFMELFMFVGLFTLFTMFAYIQTWGIGLTVAAIIYLVIRIVAARAKITPKVFAVWALKYAAGFALFVVIMAAGYFTGGFGYYKTRCKDMKCYYFNIDIETTSSAYRDEGSYDGLDQHDHSNRYTMKEEYERRKNMIGQDIEEPMNLITENEKKAKIKACMELVDKYYTLEDRTFGAFSEVLFNGRIYSIYNTGSYTRARINLYSSEDYSSARLRSTDRYYDNESFNVSFVIPADKRAEFDEEAEKIVGGTNDDFDWTLFDY